MSNEKINIVVVTDPLTWAKHWAGNENPTQWLANHQLTGATYVVTCDDRLIGCADADELVWTVNNLVRENVKEQAGER